MKFMKKALSFILAIMMLGSVSACQAAEAPVSSESPMGDTTLLTSSPNSTGASIYSDVPANADYAQAVAWCYENNLMKGTSTTAFSPDDTLTRAMLATVIYRAEGEPAVTGEPVFTDAQAGVWYSDAVVWSAEEGLLQGYGNNLFGTNDPVTVEQLEVVLGRYMGKNPTWTGDPAKNVPATRAQVAVALYQNLADSTSVAGKVLVAYFSRAGENYNVGVVEKGNTAIIAELIAEQTGADLFEIRPVNPYPSDYNEMLEIARKEEQENARPEIADTVANWDSYEVVFLGYPIWNADIPNIVYNFLESYDFTGKTIIPFCTHAGSGLSSTVSSIRSACPDATVLDGLAIAGTTAQNDTAAATSAIEKWVTEDLKDVLPKPEGTTGEVGVFNLEAGTVLLNNGVTMPILGIGTYRLSDQQAEDSVYWALRDGYRLIDTARIYGNEAGVGRGIQRAIDEGFVTREEIFVTTKMWTSDFDDGDAAVDASLRRLNLDYIDLMILHHSQPSNDVDAYKAMERAVADGKLRCVGLSNFYTGDDFDRLVNATTITPVLLQNETHPYHQSEDMKEHLAQYGTVMESWFPLGGRGNTQTLFNDPVISSIAKAHNKTSAQIILRWHLQAGNIAIPGSSNEAHIQENFEIFDFELNDEEMEQLTALNKDQRFASY